MAKLLPCPFCATELEESTIFSSRTAKHFMHPPSDDPCIASSINIVVSDRDEDQRRVAGWNRRDFSLMTVAGSIVAALADTARQPSTPSLPADVIETLRSIGLVEWGRSFEQPDEKHVSDFVDTLRITREHFGTEGETAIHGVYLAGTDTVLAHTGSSPNSPQHARILVGAWNHLVEQAVATSSASGGSYGR